jgi:hypothetical protein
MSYAKDLEAAIEGIVGDVIDGLIDDKIDEVIDDKVEGAADSLDLVKACDVMDHVEVDDITETVREALRGEIEDMVKEAMKNTINDLFADAVKGQLEQTDLLVAESLRKLLNNLLVKLP